jgi:hypothetical protein
MSDLRNEIVSKVLNSWDNGVTKMPPASTQTATNESISEKIFNYVTSHPSCTSSDVVEGTSTDLGRASATLLALYQKGKIDRRKYPNPNPDGKRDNVYVYWAATNSYKEKGVPRMKPKNQKAMKVKVPTLITPTHEHILRPRMPQAFNPETLIQDLSLREAKQLFETLKGYFGD